MENNFYFQLETQLFHEYGFCRKLDCFLEEKGVKHLAILVDEGVEKHSVYYQEVLETLQKRYPALVIIPLRGNEEPDYDYLDQIAAQIRDIKHLDLLIGIGGGSTLDMAKAVAILKTNPGKGLAYRGFDHAKIPGVPTLIIPSTAGTGSEVTINAVFTDKVAQKKLGINGRFMSASYAILDAEWTMSCPESVAVSAGIDAMVHTLESFMCRQSNPMTRTFSREAFRLLYTNLPALIDEPKNREKRQKLLLGSSLAAIGLFNSGSGIAGAFSYPIGVHYKVPHGVGGGIFITSVVAFNVAHGYQDYSELLDLIETHPELSVIEKARQFVNILKGLSNKLKVPQYLDQWGITMENVDEVAQMMIPLQAAFDQNPIPFSATTDALTLLKQHVAP